MAAVVFSRFPADMTGRPIRLLGVRVQLDPTPADTGGS